jgi:hypothetical protein
MNQHRKKRLIATRLCSIALLTLFVAASARTQTPSIAKANDDPGDTTGVPPFLSRFTLSFVPSGLPLIPPNGKRTNNGQRIIREFDMAWRASGDGSGMYVYDPATKKISKVLDGLDWLDLSTYPDGLKRWFGA